MESTPDRVRSCGGVLPRNMPDRARRALAARLAASLARGQHLVLWGPRGSGKTVLLNAVLQEPGDAHCALSTATNSLEDITGAVERAYSGTGTSGLSRRAVPAADPRYWTDGQLHVHVLALDTEMNLRAVRVGGPSVLGCGVGEVRDTLGSR